MPQNLISLLKKLVPFSAAVALRNWHTLSFAQGQFRSSASYASVDRSNNAIPWFTYPAIEYLSSLNLKNKSVLEFGSGNSTVFWSKRCKSVTSVEDDKQWFDKTKHQLRRNVAYHLFEKRSEYLEFAEKHTGKYDIIVIDGKSRHEIAKLVLKNLRKGGVIIVDNTDWLERIAKYFRNNPLFIQVDFYGFTPINPYTSVTTLFLSRDCQLEPLAQRQPHAPIGGQLLRHVDW